MPTRKIQHMLLIFMLMLYLFGAFYFYYSADNFKKTSKEKYDDKGIDKIGLDERTVKRTAHGFESDDFKNHLIDRDKRLRRRGNPDVVIESYENDQRKPAGVFYTNYPSTIRFRQGKKIEVNIASNSRKFETRPTVDVRITTMSKLRLRNKPYVYIESNEQKWRKRPDFFNVKKTEIPKHSQRKRNMKETRHYERNLPIEKLSETRFKSANEFVTPNNPQFNINPRHGNFVCCNHKNRTRITRKQTFLTKSRRKFILPGNKNTVVSTRYDTERLKDRGHRRSHNIPSEAVHKGGKQIAMTVSSKPLTFGTFNETSFKTHGDITRKITLPLRRQSKNIPVRIKHSNHLKTLQYTKSVSKERNTLKQIKVPSFNHTQVKEIIPKSSKIAKVIKDVTLNNKTSSYTKYSQMKNNAEIDSFQHKKLKKPRSFEELIHDKNEVMKLIKAKFEKGGDRKLLKRFIEIIQETKYDKNPDHYKGHHQPEMKNNEDAEALTLLRKPNETKIMDIRNASLVESSSLLSGYHLNFVNISEDLSVYSVFLDQRKMQRFIRIVLIGRKNGLVRKHVVKCKFEIIGTGNETIETDVTYYETCEGHMCKWSAYVGSCMVPDARVNLNYIILSSVYDGVELYVNVIRNIQREPEQNTYAVCVPPLFGNINILHLAEFIELSRILGANHFVFYLKDIRPNVRSLLTYYEHLRVASLFPWQLPTNDIWYHGQSLSVWDCLYRTMYNFKHVLFVDFDEILMPQNQLSWHEMLRYIHQTENVTDDEIAAYRFESAFFDQYFLDPYPPVLQKEFQQLLTLNTSLRSEKFSRFRTKMMVDPVKIFELGIHHLSKPNEEHFKTCNVHPDVAFLNHYRKCSRNYGMNCDALTRDMTAWKFKTRLSENIRKRLLGLQVYIHGRKETTKNGQIETSSSINNQN